MINIDSRVSFIVPGSDEIATGTVFLLQKNIKTDGAVEAHVALDSGGAASVLLDDLVELDEAQPSPTPNSE